MSKFNLIEQFIAAGLHEKGVLRTEGDNRVGYSETGWWRKRLVPDAPVEIMEDGSEVRRIEALDWLRRRDIENELLRQMTEYLDERGVEVKWDPSQHQYFWRLTDAKRGTHSLWHAAPTRPEALLAACVAVQTERKGTP